MAKFLTKNWLLIAVVVVFWLTAAALLVSSVQKTDGHLIYALDDPYIHMAMAKHFVHDGVWGITRHEFSSSSSSPFYTLLLAGVFAVVGPNEIVPLIINLFAATLVVVALCLALAKYRLPWLYILLVVSAIAFSIPLAGLVLTGQEHILHTLITLIFVSLSAMMLSNNEKRPRGFVWLIALAPLITTIRYEGAFTLFVVCLLFAARGRWLQAVSLGLVGALPLVVYGLISVANGSFWLPNPIIIKGSTYAVTSAAAILDKLQTIFLKLNASSSLSVITLAALITLIVRLAARRRFWESPQIVLAIFLGAVLLHMQFARTGILYRYEAYLVALGLFAVSVGLLEQLSGKERRRTLVEQPGALVLCLLLTLPILDRGAPSLTKVPQATANIYQQQYQIARFLRRFYQGATVAANDIGAINYFADIRCIDTEGLGTADVVRLAMRNKRNDREIYKLLRKRNADIAVIYDTWFPGTVPPEWTKAGEWKIEHNVVCGGDVVSFYAVDQSDLKKLRARLRAFSPELPL